MSQASGDAPGAELPLAHGGGEERPSCPRCGADVERGWRFCPFCETQLRRGAGRPPPREREAGLGLTITWIGLLALTILVLFGIGLAANHAWHKPGSGSALIEGVMLAAAALDVLAFFWIAVAAYVHLRRRRPESSVFARVAMSVFLALLILPAVAGFVFAVCVGVLTIHG